MELNRVTPNHTNYAVLRRDVPVGHLCLQEGSKGRDLPDGTSKKPAKPTPMEDSEGPAIPTRCTFLLQYGPPEQTDGIVETSPRGSQSKAQCHRLWSLPQAMRDPWFTSKKTVLFHKLGITPHFSNFIGRPRSLYYLVIPDIFIRESILKYFWNGAPSTILNT
jgi:hypothetical protein